MPKTVHSLVFSSELIFRLDNNQVQTLAELLHSYGKNLKVLVYLRDQIGYLESSYTTRVRGGHTESLKSYIQQEIKKFYLNYNNVLEQWKQIIGRDNLIVRLFSPDSLLNGNIVDDFIHSFDMRLPHTNDRAIQKNASIDKNILEHIKEIYEIVNQSTNPQSRVNISRALERFVADNDLSGQKTAVDHQTRMSLQAFFEHQNTLLSFSYFSGKVPLFPITQPQTTHNTQTLPLDLKSKELWKVALKSALTPTEKLAKKMKNVS